MQDAIFFNGKWFPCVSYKGYLFSNESLLCSIMKEGEPINEEAKEIDDSIAYYFTNTEFERFSPKYMFYYFKKCL